MANQLSCCCSFSEAGPTGITETALLHSHSFFFLLSFLFPWHVPSATIVRSSSEKSPPAFHWQQVHKGNFPLATCGQKPPLWRWRILQPPGQIRLHQFASLCFFYVILKVKLITFTFSAHKCINFLGTQAVEEFLAPEKGQHYFH